MTLRDKLLDTIMGVPSSQVHEGNTESLKEELVDHVLDTIGMTFREVQEACDSRSKAFPSSLGKWSLLEWAGALLGEQGEFAEALLEWVAAGGRLANNAKKIRRDGADKLKDMAKELADVVIYSTIIANKLGLDLGAEVARKFNEVSDRRDLINHGAPKTPRVREP